MSTLAMFDDQAVMNSKRQQKGARRCLFGKPDRKNLDDALKKQEEIVEEIDSKRFREYWGFDPKGFPVDGGVYICSPVDLRTEHIPEFYTKVYASRKSKPAGRPRESWRGPYNSFVFSDDHPRHRNVKRKLQLDFDDSNLENSENVCSLPSQLPHQSEIPVTSSSLTVPSCPSTTMCSVSDQSSHPRSDSSPSISTLQRSVSSVVLSDRQKSFAASSRKRCRISPSSFLDLATPRSIQTQLTTPRQTQLKDFFPIQKKRCSSSHFEV